MSKTYDRFVWALPFLDLFTCALGAVFMLTILSVQERQDIEAYDPAGYIFITASYGDKPLSRKETEDIEKGIGLNLPSGFEISPTSSQDRIRSSQLSAESKLAASRPVVLIGDNRTLVVVSVRLPYGISPGNSGVGEIS